MKTNIGYYLGLVVTNQSERNLYVKKIAGLLCEQNFVSFEELVLLGYASSTKEVREAAKEATITAGKKMPRRARSKIIELGVFHDQANVQEIASEAYIALCSTKTHEAQLIERLQQQPHDQPWYGVLELLCQLAPGAKEVVPHFFEILKKEGRKPQLRDTVEKALVKFKLDVVKPCILEMLRSNDPTHVVKVLGIFTKHYLLPDQELVTEFKQQMRMGITSAIQDRAQVALLKYKKL